MAAYARASGWGWVIGDDTNTVARARGSGWETFAGSGGGGPPAGVTTVTAVTAGETSALVSYSYSAGDATGFQYRLDGGTPVTAGASPFTISSLTANTEYDLEIRATNGFGDGDWSSVYEFGTENPGEGGGEIDPGGESIDVGMAVETNTAFALWATQSFSTGVAVETDIAYALTASAGLAVGVAVESDTALALTHSQAFAVGMTVETDAALALVATSGLSVGMAVETDTAFALSSSQAKGFIPATETDIAFALEVHDDSIAIDVGMAIESDIALALITRGVQLATEGDIALALTATVGPKPPTVAGPISVSAYFMMMMRAAS